MFLWASGHSIFTNQLIHNLFYVCFCLKTYFNIEDWFINIELTVNSTITHAWVKFN